MSLDEHARRPIAARWRDEVRRALPAAAPDVVDEVAGHLAQAWQDAVDAGVAPAAADEKVRADLAAWHRLTARRGAPSWRQLATGWGGEIRRAFRLVGVNPSFAAGIAGLTALTVTAAVSCLAVGYGLLWRPLPYPDGDRLAVVWQVQQGEVGQVSLADFRDLAAADVFDGATALSGGRGSLRVGDEIDRVNALDVDPVAFALLGARPQRGRLLTADDTGRDFALLSDRVWRTRFGAASEVIGSPIWLSGRTFTVVGVLQPGFDFELPVAGRFFLEDHDLWTLMPPPDAGSERRDFTGYEGLVRLRPGVDLAQAQAAVDTIARRLESTFAATNHGRTFQVVPLRDEIVARMRQPLLLAALAAAVTLAIALANMIALVSVRLSGAQTELAVRQALGAGGLRLRRHLFTEHALLVAAGTILGVGAARWVVLRLVASSAAHLPRPDAIRFDLPVLAASGALGLGLTLALTVLPARHERLTDALRKVARAGGGGHRVRHTLIAVQVALALTLSSAGALVGLSLVRLAAVAPGFDVDGVSAARVSAYAAQHAERADVERFVAAVVTGLTELPGVARAAASSSLPLSGQSSTVGVMVEGQPLPPAARPSAGWEFVTPGFFETLGIPLRAGRAFAAGDRERTGHVTVINDALARLLFPNGDAIGRRLLIGGGGPGDPDWHEIVGVVNDVRQHALGEAPTPRVYDLFGQHYGRTVYLVVRSDAGHPPVLATTIRRVVAGVDPQAPVFEAATLRELVARSTAAPRLTAQAAAGLALAGLALALGGVAAITASGAALRRREMGVRAALGAAPGDVFRLVLRESAATVGLGAVAGMAGAAGAARLLTTRVFGLSSQDAALVVPAVAALLVAAAVAAALPSARRAADADPLDAMRAD